MLPSPGAPGQRVRAEHLPNIAFAAVLTAAYGFGPRAAPTGAPLVGTMEIAPSYTF